ncbi:hemagglutinin repeat-containing protein [Cedecea sp. FDAARGOS_727]|uniref:hemagglutinin repeat-containing protein n=1 Tax=Cedecea sp. FDAARGOS_727 TaxID=2545798 RepID=UPI00143EE9EA|nr:hemagglutinin repeat-containing protein [Cedecea sp. FDAARGOS_727]QIX97643.1 filamentous hemagglutinin N-terminal domain-containing protein [Cedecea sp. FDAARGOS_727]
MDKHPVGVTKRLVSYLVMFLVAGQPVFPTVAATINPMTPGAQMDQAGNGVPVLNIATPNPAGISHNQFQDYNVGKEGLILNNATGQLTQTQLGGLIQNNPNLKAGQEASGIINEVIGGSRSQLQGYTEVAGKAANVMVANPYGITCNGCGFINTPNATLTTGKPQFDAAGNLLALDVSKGTITVEGQGLDASKSDALSIIARATEVNAGIHAKDLKVTTGANRVSAGGAVTPVAGEGAAPTVAVDTGALGGMYANRIHLVSSEKGVGVNLGNLNARQGDIILEANGRLAVNNSLASGSLAAQGESVTLTGDHKAGGPAQVNSRGDLALANGKLVSDGNITLNASGKLTASTAALTAGNDVALNVGTLNQDAASEINAGGAIRSATAGAANHAGKMTAGSTVSLSASQLANSGKIVAGGELSAKTGNLTNSGTLQSRQGMRLESISLDNTGQVLAGDGLAISTGDARVGGTLSSGGDLSLSATNLTSFAGAQLQSRGKMLLEARSAATFEGVQVAKGDLTINAGSLTHRGSSSGSNVSLRANHIDISGNIQADNAMTLNADTIVQQAGSALLAQKALQVNAGQFTNRGSLDSDALTLAIASAADNQAGGKLTARNDLTLTGNTLTNGGQMAGSTLSLTLNKGFSNLATGSVLAEKTLDVFAPALTNAGRLAAASLNLTTQTLDNGGLVQGGQSLALSGAELTNRLGGKIISGSGLTLSIPQLVNAGLISVKQGLAIDGLTLANGGNIEAKAMTLRAGERLSNQKGGVLLAEDALTLAAPDFDNAGSVQAKTLAVDVSGTFGNAEAGRLSGQQSGRLTAGQLANQGGISAGNLDITADGLNNSGLLQSEGELSVSVRQLVNAGFITAKQGAAIDGLSLDNRGHIEAHALRLALGDKLTNQAGGVLLAEGRLKLNAPALDNAGKIQGNEVLLSHRRADNSGQILGLSSLSLNAEDGVSNSGQLLSKGGFVLSSGWLDNQGQLAATDLSVDARRLANAGLMQGDQSFRLIATALNNLRGGEIISGSGLALNIPELINAGLISVEQGLAIDAATLENSGKIEARDLQLTLRDRLINQSKGVLLADDSLRLSAAMFDNDGQLVGRTGILHADNLTNSGILHAKQSLTLSGQTLNNATGAEISGEGGSLHVEQLVNAGLISARQGWEIDALSLKNSGNIEAGDLTLKLAQKLDNQTGGVLLADNTLELDSVNAENAGKLIASNARLAVNGLINGGLIQGNQSLSYRGSSLNNKANGQLLSEGNLAINAARLDNAGRMQGQTLTLDGGQSGGTNSGQMLGKEALTILFGGAFNNDGRLIGLSALSLKASQLDNTGILAAKSITLDGGAGQVNNAGLIQADGRLVFSAGSLLNQKNGSLTGGDDVTLTVPLLTNSGLISSDKVLHLDGTTLDNGGNIEGAGLQLNLAGRANNQTSGILLADNGLTLQASELNNSGKLSGDNVTITASQGQNDGLIQGQSLTLNGGSISNRGSLLGKSSLTATLADQLTNSGQLLSQGGMQVRAKNLANSGSLAADAINVQTGTLDNQSSGKLLATNELNIASGSFTNSGTLASENARLAVNIMTNGGLVQGNNSLTVEGFSGARSFAIAQPAAVNVLNNLSGGQLLSDGELRVTVGKGDNSGKLQGKTINLTAGSWSNGGTVLGSSALTLNTGELENRASGKILSGSSLNLQLPQLTNDGVIQAQQNLMLKLDNLNNAGTLSGNNVILSIARLLNNQTSGRLLATRQLTGQSGTLNNSGVLAADNLDLTANQIDNQGVLQGENVLGLNTSALHNLEGGQLISGRSLSLSIPQMVNLGLISIKDALTLSGSTLDNHGTLQAASLALNFADSILNRNNARLLAQKDLTLRAASLTNQGTLAGDTVAVTTNVLTNGGLLQGNNALTLDSLLPSNLMLTNQVSGKILTGGALSLSLPQLTNQGVILSQQGLTLTATQLDNGGRLAANNAMLAVSILNNGGVLQGDNELSITATTLSNTAPGKLLSGGLLWLKAGQLGNAGLMQGQQLTLDAGNWNNGGSALGLNGLTAQVDNQLINDGRVLSQGNARINAGALNNTGSLLGEGDVILEGGSLLNGGNIQGDRLTASNLNIDNAGSVIGLKSLTLQPQQGLTNRAGGAMQTQGAFVVGGRDIVNGGLWQAQYLKLNAQQLQNNGTLQSTGNMDLALTSGLSNTGTMVANGTAILTAPTLTNGGQLTAKNLSLRGTTLTSSGSISGVDGLGVTLGGNLDLQSGAKLLTNGLLNIGASVLTNLGHIQGNALTLNAAGLNNQGRMEANTALNASLRGNADNGRGGVMLSQGTFQLGAQQLNNDGTLQGNGNTQLDLRERGSNQGQLLSGGTLTLNAPGFTNGGWVQGLNLWLSGGSLANSGTVLAQQQGTLGGSYILNNGMLQGANLTINPGQLDNNGTLYTAQNLGITASQVNNGAAAKLLSQGNLTINAGTTGLQGQVTALGNLALTSQASFNQLAALAAGNTLSLTSQGDINVNGLMQGQGLQLSAAGTLNNNGQLRAGYGESHLNAGQLNLNGPGSVQAGGTLRLTSRNGINNTGFVGTAGDLIASAGGTLLNSALLYAGNNMSLLANSIRNYRGDILAGNNLWMQRDAAGNANAEVVNTSGSIETQNGDISIRTGHLLNERDGLTESRSYQPGSDSSNNAMSLNVKVVDLGDGNWGFYQDFHGSTQGGSITSTVAPTQQGSRKRVLSGSTVVDVVASGGVSRIAAKKDLHIYANSLDNQASNLLAGNAIDLSGSVLNNQSYFGYAEDEYRVYKYTGRLATIVATPKTMKDIYNKRASKNRTVTYYLDGAPETLRRDTDQVFRSVIQAGGAVVANFSNNISNTSSAAYAGGYAPGRSAPGLNLATGPGVGAGSQAAGLNNSGNTLLSAPQATINLAGAGNGVGHVEDLADNSTKNNGLNAVDTRPQGVGDFGQSDDKQAGIKEQTTALINRNGPDGKPIELGGKDATFTDLGNAGGKHTSIGSGAVAPEAVGPQSETSGSVARDKTGGITSATEQVIASSSGGKTPPPAGYDYRPVSLTDISAIASTLTASGSPVRLSDYPLPASNNGYFVANKDPKSPYLIVTNPKLDGLGQLDNSLFNDLYKLAGTSAPTAPQENRSTYTESNNFLGSDYFLARLNLRPEYDYRFLGDAAFDTRYVSNQILNQTGNRYVNGIGSDLEQMQYLIDHAAQARDKLGLQLGVSLSADQVAALDTSILWWETVVIDGQKVLVPKLYLSPKDIAVNNGSVIAGNQVILNGGSITNSGSTLQGKNLLAASSQNAINNINGGAINSAGSLQLSALGDINNIGSTIAGQKVSLESVGGSIINQTLTNQWNASSPTSGWKGPSLSLTKTELGSLASISAGDSLSMSAGKDIVNTGANLSSGGDMLLKAWDNIAITGNQLVDNKHRGRNINDSIGNQESLITSGGNLSLLAGQDLTVAGSRLNAEESVRLQAGRDISLLAAETSRSDKYSAKKKVEINESVRQQGSEIASGGSTMILAGRDVNTEAAQVTAHGDIGVGAGRDINLLTATESDYHYVEETKTKKGFLSKKTTHTINESSSTREAGTLLSGDNVTLKAGNDLLVKGSSVVGDGSVALHAGNNVDIVAATDTDSSWHFKETKKSGLMGTGGIGFTIGSSKSTHDLREQGTTQSQSISTVGSTGGNVSVNAGGVAHIGGADLVAGKDLSVSGESVLIEPGHDKRTRDEKFEQKSSGLTVALSGAVGDAINNAVTTAQATKNESDGRLAALQATKTALAGGQAYLNSQQATASADPNNGIGVSISLTTQKSKSEQHMESDAVNGSSLTAGNNLSIAATGKSEGSGNIVIGGSQLKAGGDTTLAAAQDIVLSGAANTQLTTGKNSSSGGGVGVSIGVGGGSGGISVFANVNAAKGKEKGNGTAWTETTLDSGGTVSLTSGRDAVLNGAQVNGDKIVADIGRDLLMSSQQDSNRYDSKQTSVAAGGSFTFGSMTGSGYISASQDKMKSTYDSVQEQTGLFAGNGGFDITVGRHTQLDGAVIASTASADKNSLDTGTLGFSDVGNKADYKVSHSGISLSGGSNMSAGSMLAANGIANAGSLLAGMNGKGHAEGTTQSAVADGTITIRDKANQRQDVAALSRDTEHANDSIGQIFDKEKEQKRLQTAQLVGEIGGQMTNMVSTYGDTQALEAARAKGGQNASMTAEQLRKTDDYQKAFSEYGIGGKYQMVAQSVSGILAGAAGGDLKKALAGGLNPLMAQTIKGATTEDGKVNESANLMAHAVWGALAAQLSGGNAAAGAAGAFSGELAARHIAAEMFPGKDPGDLSQDQKQVVSLLGTMAAGLAGGVVGNSTASATTGAQAGKNAVENNGLSFGTGMDSYGASVASWGQYAENNNLTPEQKQAGLDKLARGDLPEGQSPATGLLKAWGAGASTVVAPVLLPATATAGSVIAAGAIGGSANVFNQLNSGEPFSATDALIATGISGLTQGRGFWFTEAASITGAYAGAKLQGKDVTAPMIGAGFGTLSGAGIGKGVERLQTAIPFTIPKLTGAVAESAGSEYIGSAVQNLAEKVQKKLEKTSDAK